MNNEQQNSQSQPNVTYLQNHENTAENMASAEIAIDLQEPSQAVASDSNANDDRAVYTFSIEDAERYLSDAGYTTPSRTISYYCQVNKLKCKKRSSSGVRKWFVQKESLDEFIEKQKKDGIAPASNRKQSQEKPIEKVNKGDSKEPQATANDEQQSQASAVANDSENLKDKLIEKLEGEVTFLRGELQAQRVQTDKINETATLVARVAGAYLQPPKHERGDNVNDHNA